MILSSKKFKGFGFESDYVFSKNVNNAMMSLYLQQFADSDLFYHAKNPSNS